MNEVPRPETVDESYTERFERQQREVLAYYENAFRNIVPTENLTEDHQQIQLAVAEYIGDNEFFSPTTEEISAFENSPQRAAGVDNMLQQIGDRYKVDTFHETVTLVERIIEERKG